MLRSVIVSESEDLPQLRLFYYIYHYSPSQSQQNMNKKQCVDLCIVETRWNNAVQ